MERFEKAEKPRIEENSFVKFFNIGSGGYWRGPHIINQIEDFIDCLKALYSDVHFIFKLDHSSGYQALKPDGLTIEKGK